MVSDEEIFFVYGRNAVISRKDQFTFVHLDRPSADLVKSRTANFDAQEYFKCGCRVCQVTKESGVIVFDDFPYEDEEILLE